MSNVSGERRYYDNAALWERERFLGNERELRRFTVTAEQIPSSVSSLLDVGSGNGAFLAFLEERRPTIEVLGLERSTVAIELALCQAVIEPGSVDSLPFDDESFDCVSALEVLEHLPFGVYERALEEISRVARKFVLVSVPFDEVRRGVLCSYCGCQFNPHYHMRSFDERRISELLPNWRLLSSKMIHVSEDVLSPVIHRLASIGRPRRPSGTTVCPQCGFQARDASDDAPSTHPGRVRKLWRRGKQLLPRRSRPNWIVALYGRNS